MNFIEKVFLEEGWIVNRIYSDYGEDLSLQPVSEGAVEKCRVYVQVKSVSSKRARRITLKREDLFIWQFSSEIFIAVCFVMESQEALYYWVNEHQEPSQFADLDKKAYSLPIKIMKTLDTSAINRLKFLSREVYYESTLRKLSSFIEDNRGYAKNKHRPDVLAAKQASVNVACRLLTDYGVLSNVDDGFAPSKVFIEENLYNIVENSVVMCRSIKKKLPKSSLFWAARIINHVFERDGSRDIPYALAWSLVNTVDVVVTRDEIFKDIVAEMVDFARRELRHKKTSTVTG
ncbi:DUF4365 domain-containing protein [Methyloceanibacter stevinii]|uniref:DUF4365 domain-containing protein n=1 Tax=Methyloceanibacter stevinii TaxID=1774970 RepID=UPI00130182D0|nr:DUF4365 domain-containing protein [Methyloceanibacter stevinii]